jgi:hypothetical protein
MMPYPIPMKIVAVIMLVVIVLWAKDITARRRSKK